MKPTRIISTLLCAGVASLGAQAGDAQSGLRGPAELPPAEFRDTQYVDSAGCVFIRAGVAGSVTWVPRVTRDRRQICGFEPSIPAASPAPQAAAEQAAPAPRVAPVVIGSGAAPKATPRTVATVVTPATPAAGMSPQTRFLPEHMIATRAARVSIKTPEGYRPAWTDGRLNPRRAEQTLEGQAQMLRVWTNTVPRRLVD